MLAKLVNTVVTVAFLALIGLAGFFALNAGRERMRSETYAGRLEHLAANYDALQQSYRRVLEKTAITAILVRDGQVFIETRTADDASELIATPYTTEHELYVDYLVRDGRIQIRRVFDATTAPSDGVLVNEGLASVDWLLMPASAHGKAVYRKVSEGRWVVTVTGNGSMGLERSPRPLSHGEPQLEPESALPETVDLEAIKHVSLREVADYWWQRLKNSMEQPQLAGN